jgi:pyridoxamine 5'-phosphate oxidase
MSCADVLPPWRSVVRGAREREGKRSGHGRWLQLATVAKDGTPRVRTLVFRGWSGPSQLDLLTDGRSAKAQELALGSAIEICWLLPRARTQFRLRGSLAVLPKEEEKRARLQHWHGLSPAGRALWDWPVPGVPFDREALFAEALADDAPIPAHFLLLRVDLQRVEALELTGHPHRRRRWRIATGWEEEPLNP